MNGTDESDCQVRFKTCTGAADGRRVEGRGGGGGRGRGRG